MKTINETYPQIKVGTILISKEQIKYIVTDIFKYTIHATTDEDNLYSFNTTEIKQMKLTNNNMKTFEIYKNGTHHANVQAKNIKQATEMYAAAIGDYNFNIYEEEEDEEEDD